MWLTYLGATPNAVITIPGKPYDVRFESDDVHAQLICTPKADEITHKALIEAAATLAQETEKECTIDHIVRLTTLIEVASFLLRMLSAAC